MVETISQRLPVTVKLTVVAVVFETVLGITAGILAARRNSFFDNLVLVSTTVLVSIPVFVLAWPSTCSGSNCAGCRSPGSPTAGSATCCPVSCWPRCRWPMWPG